MTEVVTAIPVHYLNQVANYLDNIGKPVDTWLAHADLSRDDIIGNTRRLDFATYSDLLVSASELSGREDIGLVIGESLSINSHGMLGLALMNCVNLRQVLDFFVRYLATRTPLIRLRLENTEHTVRVLMIEAQALGGIHNTFLEAFCLTLVKVLRAVQPDYPVIENVSFNFSPPGYVNKYHDAFDCDVRFNAPFCSLSVPKVLLDVRLPSADEHTLLQATAFCDDELSKLEAVRTTASDVKQMLFAARDNLPGLQQVAKALNMTPRTLHRHLRAEQTSFQQLTDDVRFSLAKQHLQYQHIPIKQIAFRLGYADVANFRRAFKRWSGLSPQAFRREHL